MIYSEIGGLSTEARQKLDQIKPRSVGQASRISGVSPADVAVLLVALEQKAILVPTPGQTEQEYLATYLKQKEIFYSTTQAGFSLQNAIAAAADFACKIPPVSTAQFEPVITAFLKKLQP